MEVFTPQRRALGALGVGLVATVLLSAVLAPRPAPAITTPAARDQVLRRIPTGHRAVAVRCGAETAACGLVAAGCRADLIGFEKAADGRPATAVVLLEDALILAVAPPASPADRTVTVWVAVKLEATEQLLPAVSQSPVALAVRRPGDAARRPARAESQFAQR